jgi:BlaI family transcriptional regulator, penicillinase repressor
MFGKQSMTWFGTMKKDLESYIPTRRELQILKVLWEKGSASVREVQTATFQTERLSYNTILTLMRILYAKGILSHKKSGRVHVYEPILTRGSAVRNQVRDMVIRIFDGKPEKMIESILDNEYRDVEQLGELKRFIESKLLHKAFVSNPIVDLQPTMPIPNLLQTKSADSVKLLSITKPHKIEEPANNARINQQ